MSMPIINRNICECTQGDLNGQGFLICCGSPLPAYKALKAGLLSSEHCQYCGGSDIDHDNNARCLECYRYQ